MENKKKVALITGAGGYIGGECAVMLAAEGYEIAVLDVNETGIDKTLQRIAEIGGIAKGYTVDVTDYRDVDRVVASVVKDFGRIDASIHVAGGSARIAKDAKYLPLIDQDPAVIDHVLKVNLYGAFWVSRAAGKVMVAQGEGGRIINFSSIIAFNGFPTCTDYAAAKGGVVSMTKALAKEMGAHGITVNSVAPGLVHRPNEPDSDHYVNSNFLGKKCLGEDVANLVSFLISEKAGFITGQTYIIDGGRSLAMKGND